MSRYDLPFGPLHLLPPPVLEDLSIQEGDKNEVISAVIYIDEKSGEVRSCELQTTSQKYQPSNLPLLLASIVADQRAADGFALD